MYKRAVVFLLVLFLPVCVNAAWDLGAVPYQGEAPPVTQYRYIGWTTSAGVPSTFPDNRLYPSEDRTALAKWTATENGTLKGIRIAIPSEGWSTDYAYGLVLKDTGDNLETIASVTLPNSLTANSWTTEYDFTGGSLEFTTGDVLYLTVAFDPSAAYSTGIGVDRSGTSGVDYYYVFDEAGYNVGASTPTSFTEASMTAYTPRQLGVVVSYDVSTGEDEEDPVATITSPTSDATYTVTGDNKINLGGTCSDNGTVASMTWASTDDSGDCTGDLPWTTWEISNIPVPTTGTVITVTAEDLAENTGTDQLTVSFSPPASTSVEGWDDSDNPPDDAIQLSATITGDRIYFNDPWTASQAGVLSGVYFYVGSVWDVTQAWIVAYKVDGSDYVLLAQEPIVTAALSNYNFVSFSTAVSGQSLRFAQNDQLLYGIAVDVGTGFVYGRNTTGGAGLIYARDKDLSNGPMDLVIATDIITSADYDPGFTLAYTSLPGDVTNPSVAITTPAANVSTSVSIYAIAGTASDETELDYVQWTCAESDDSGLLTVSDGAWSETLSLSFGTNTITVSAYDTTGNSATDTVVITQVNPTSTFSGSGNFQ